MNFPDEQRVFSGLKVGALMKNYLFLMVAIPTPETAPTTGIHISPCP
jgi:hypothetical protein